MKAQKPRILYADENRNNCEFIIHDLVDYDVTCVTTATEALRKGKAGGFDLILLDDRLQGATGIEICQQLRVYDHHTPILILSGPDESWTRSKAIEAGAQDYWPTPVDLEAVSREIKGLLEVRKRIDAERKSVSQAAGQEQESGLPGSGRGRKDVIERTGVYPVSAAEGASPEAKIHDEMSWGQGRRGGAGYADHGDSEISNLEQLQEELSGAVEKNTKSKAARKK